MLQGPNGRSNKGGEGVQEGSVAPAGRKTLETLGAADSIAEALEMAASEKKRHEVSLFIPHWQYLLSMYQLAIFFFVFSRLVSAVFQAVL